jgi:hypothetical protein
MLDPFVNTIKNHIAPDFGIDFAYEGMRSNNGLTFTHRKLPDRDIYFVCNIQDKRSTIPVTFRVKNSMIRKWNPYTGEISAVMNFSLTEDGVKVPLDLAPYESMFLEFSPGVPETYITKTDFTDIKFMANNKIRAYALKNGSYNTSLVKGGKEKIIISDVEAIPSPFNVTGNWNMEFSGKGFSVIDVHSDFLYSWTNDSLTRNFSGTARYDLVFKLLPEYLEKDLDLFLDLGKVGNIAEAFLNDKYAGTVWIRDQKLNITKIAKGGNNKLTVLVTNTLINRVSSMSSPPSVPENLIPFYGKEDVIKEIPREFGFKPLPPSGLIGPVSIIPRKYNS